MAPTLLHHFLGHNPQFLVNDPFDSISSIWTLQRGAASIADGWLRLQGSGGIPRDAFLMTGEGSSWTDYRVVTRFHSDGGGDNWYNALINFRVQQLTGWSDGTWYGFYLYPPNSHIAPSGGFFLVNKTDLGPVHLTPTYYNPSSMRVGENLVDIEIGGGWITLLLNGQLAARYLDPIPIPSGGVALGSIWESVTRYDSIQVIEPYGIIEERDTKSKTLHKAGSIAPVRFQAVDRNGNNQSSPKISVTVLRVRNTQTGATQAALAPGPAARPRQATAEIHGKAYQTNLNTRGMATGPWQLEISVNGDPRHKSIPLKLR